MLSQVVYIDNMTQEFKFLFVASKVNVIHFFQQYICKMIKIEEASNGDLIGYVDPGHRVLAKAVKHESKSDYYNLYSSV